MFVTVMISSQTLRPGTKDLSYKDCRVTMTFPMGTSAHVPVLGQPLTNNMDPCAWGQIGMDVNMFNRTAHVELMVGCV